MNRNELMERSGSGSHKTAFAAPFLVLHLSIVFDTDALSLLLRDDL